MGDFDDDEDEFSLSGGPKKYTVPLTKMGFFLTLGIGAVLLVLSTVGVVLIIGEYTDAFCHNNSDDSDLEEYAESYKLAVDAFAQGYSTEVCYDPSETGVPPLWSVFTLEGIGGTIKLARVEGELCRVCYPTETIPWVAMSPPSSSDPSSSSSSDVAYTPIWS